ncbi:MAG: endolytic transglycosylase MltG [Oscillibacter sp.]|jgi:UPF0755 protein|nr:endolytic transglycosylase MltG [Oscillibacter sp.]
MSDFQNDETSRWNAAEVRANEEQRNAARQRPHRKNKPFNWLLYFIVVVAVSTLLAGIGWLLINDFCSLNKASVTTTIEVTSDDDLGSIATKLHDAGLVKYKWFFKAFGVVDKASGKIGIGTYELNSNMDYVALVTAMHNASGNLNAETVKVTIPEGYTVAQTIALLAKNGVNTADALTTAAQTATFDYSFIDASSQDISRLEGYLFPDTYEFYVNEKPEAALNRLLSTFNSKLDETRTAQIKASDYTLEQLVTIASLIEKETDGSDQAKIASVIYNRLNDSGSHGTYKMLQIDASLLYALPEHTGALTNDDKKTDSPYNLYKNAGLPPTPIANPGMASIDAALSPETTSYYYYALGKDGVHHYFETYNEHVNFVNSDDYAG